MAPRVTVDDSERGRCLLDVAHSRHDADSGGVGEAFENAPPSLTRGARHDDVGWGGGGVKGVRHEGGESGRGDEGGGVEKGGTGVVFLHPKRQNEK
eukprot:CAMPEP_0194320694 /NCGR_PEP_ID=MMETSP0171-20130528/16965_1 /TAXON_ID=218684 /ORGANISM="Corethron pennatum, Strain L29A3" /LENGTH=95 /DNA_ID=CAMNT_0039078287 /DNA_START=695 /DNA_END=982 /DNA_ORIENTATION=-